MSPRTPALVVAGLSLGFAPAPLPKADDSKALQGTWVITKAQYGASDDRSTVGLHAVIKGNNITFLRKGKPTASWDMTLDPKKKPKALDLKRGPRAFACIYEVRGNTLTFSYYLSGKPGERPTRFGMTESRAHTITLRRDKGAKPK
jgi:uncharacterized protein (TIGR03067 family)